MEKLILFSNDCPRCKVLKNKLKEKNIEYEISENFEELEQHNLQTLPVLKYEGNYYTFGDAVKLVGEMI